MVRFANERISPRSTYRFRNSSALGLDNEIPSAGVDARCGEEHTRFDPRDLGQHEVKMIMKGHVGKDHGHLFESIPPHVTISFKVDG